MPLGSLRQKQQTLGPSQSVFRGHPPPHWSLATSSNLRASWGQCYYYYQHQTDQTTMVGQEEYWRVFISSIHVYLQV